jgi:hypothetical protein
MVLGAVVAGLCLFGYISCWKENKLQINGQACFIASVTLGVPNFLSFFCILALTAFMSGAFVYQFTISAG